MTSLAEQSLTPMNDGCVHLPEFHGRVGLHMIFVCSAALLENYRVPSVPGTEEFKNFIHSEYTLEVSAGMEGQIKKNCQMMLCCVIEDKFGTLKTLEPLQRLMTQNGLYLVGTKENEPQYCKSAIKCANVPPSVKSQPVKSQPPYLKTIFGNDLEKSFAPAKEAQVAATFFQMKKIKEKTIFDNALENAFAAEREAQLAAQFFKMKKIKETEKLSQEELASRCYEILIQLRDNSDGFRIHKLGEYFKIRQDTVNELFKFVTTPGVQDALQEIEKQPKEPKLSSEEKEKELALGHSQDDLMQQAQGAAEFFAELEGQEIKRGVEKCHTALKKVADKSPIEQALALCDLFYKGNKDLGSVAENLSCYWRKNRKQAPAGDGLDELGDLEQRLAELLK
jgi:hypothetical protein